MQLKFLKLILDGQENFNRIAGIAWSPNNEKLAVATADRQILLFHESGERRDKFATKPSNSANGKMSYVIRGLAFSPDSTKLAVGQSDNIVYVYKLGDGWGDKKVICNKFPQTSSITALIWLASGPIIAGLDDGKVQMLQCKTNKSQKLYSVEHMVVSLATNSRGTGFLSGYSDGSIIRYWTSENGSEPAGKVLQHSVAPYALAWPQGSIAAAGYDKKITFYDSEGRTLKIFDYSRSEDEGPFTVAVLSPNSQLVAFGSYNKVRVYSKSPNSQTWNESATKTINNLYSVSALAWRRDAARFVIGSVSGAVLMFESFLRRIIWQQKLELIFIASSQLLVKSLSESSKDMIIETHLGLEIDDVRIMGKTNYLVARTQDSLIVGDLTRNLISEVPWVNSGRHEKFYFENPNVCLIFNAGELSLLEYGENTILGSVRTEFVNPHVISVRLNERGNSRDNKKLAYLLDMKTISVVDLLAQSVIVQFSHDSKIDWMELSETANKVLFRDKKRRLIVVDIVSGKKQTLLGNVSFVQWVVQSDVAVAQSDNNLAIWYNIDLPEHVTIVPIRGDCFDVTREKGKTLVWSKEGLSEYTYQLTEGLVEFGTALNDCDFSRAIQFLEELKEKAAARSMWHNLAIVALEQSNLAVAQRCFAALENGSKAFYLSQILDSARKYDQPSQHGILLPEVNAKMALLNSNLKGAERIYLEQGNIESALDMYKNLKMWDEAIQLAERRGYFDKIDMLKKQQMSFLLSTGQEDKAGKVLEDQGEVKQAMTLFLKGKKVAKAARLALKFPQLLQDENVMAAVTESLIKSEFYELAGDVTLNLSRPEAALSLYCKGGAYERAIELARKYSPDEVTTLEEKWGDWLVSKRQLDASINHYIEAGATEKALEASVGAKQWRKAIQIAKVLDDSAEISKYASDLSRYLVISGDLEGAKDLLVRAGLHKEAIELLCKQGLWDYACQIAEQYLSSNEMRETFLNLASNLEEQGKYRDAEKVYIAIKEPDLAISMYKRLELYDSMIRLVEKFHKDLVESTHIHLASQLEAKGKLKNAETHFLAAGDWKSAVHMFCNAGRWEDGFRIAKEEGTEGASNQVAYMWAKSLPVEGAARLLTKLGLLDTALNFACDSGQFDFAADLCRITGKPTEEVHLKIAMSLEDEGKFQEAEEEFIRAKKPKEAILMYTHSGDWKSALKVAENYSPESVNEILVGQAALAFEMKNYAEYEMLLLRAQRSDVIVQNYRESNMLDDAIRIAEEYLPNMLPELLRLKNQEKQLSASSSSSQSLFQQAQDYARNEEFRKAAECLIQISSLSEDLALIERSLIRAGEICTQFLEGDDAIDIARLLGPRLINMNQISQAAQIYLAAEMPKDAVDVFIQTAQWSKAHRLAKQISPELVSYVEDTQKNHLKSEDNIEELADIDIMSALDMLAEHGQWTRCLEKAKLMNAKILHKYLALYAAQLIRDGDSPAALSLYITHGAPPIQQNFQIYNRLSVDCVALRDQIGSNIYKDLRTFLFQLSLAMKNSDYATTEFCDQVESLLLIAHYYTTRAACRQLPALQGIAVKLSVALLRYTDTVAVDKAFFEAGIDLRNVGRESEAFVMLNHYLDVCEAIEENSGDLVDHTDLSATDFPSSVPIPKYLHLKDEPDVHEEVREWVLAVSMDQKVDQTLALDDRNLFESNLGLSGIVCVVTGYPVLGRQPITFQRSKMQANRDAWSKLTVAAKMEPQSDIPEIIEFIEKWCGSANFVMH